MLAVESVLKHYQPAAGYHDLISTGAGSLEHINFGVLCLSVGQSYQFKSLPDHEAALTILTGTLNASADGQRWHNLGGRKTVFDGGTDTLLLASGNSVDLQAVSDCEIAVAQAANAEAGSVQLFAAGKVNAVQRGLPGWQREVRTYVAPSGGNARLIIGETINAVGQWSSFPPHKHDQNNLPLEAKLEEVYLFKLDPPTGFAFQGLYSPDDPDTANRAFIVRNNDVVAIPNGYHPVAPAPGHKVYYYWVLAGIGNVLKFRTDETMRWLEPGL